MEPCSTASTRSIAKSNGRADEILSTYCVSSPPGRRNVILLREPSDAQIRRFLEGGASRCGAPPGYPVNHRRGRLGAGLETYARPVEAIRGWKMYETRWIKLCSP